MVAITMVMIMAIMMVMMMMLLKIIMMVFMLPQECFYETAHVHPLDNLRRKEPPIAS